MDHSPGSPECGDERSSRGQLVTILEWRSWDGRQQSIVLLRILFALGWAFV